jgi:hypothetical protein
MGRFLLKFKLGIGSIFGIFKMLGSKTLVLIQKDHQSKLDHNTIECTFLGYEKENKAHKFMQNDDIGIIY